jgi:hypothetical protein
MQPDELEARHCRKGKIAMAKSPKSRCCKGRCCKVDAVKVKGLPGGSLFDIGVYRFSDHTGSLFMSWGQTRLLADYGIVYLHLKTKTIKNRKGLSQESKKLPKTDSLTRCQSWIDPPPPCFLFGVSPWSPWHVERDRSNLIVDSRDEILFKGVGCDASGF